MSVDLESRTKAALRQFDSNMSGIFDRASFYDQDLYSQAAYPQLTRAQMCFKYSLFAANCIFLIFGCVLIAVGSYATTNQIGALSGNTLPIGIAVLGVFILLLSLLGGVAAYKESRVFLLVYFLFLLLLTLILFFVGIAVYVERNNALTYIQQGWDTASPDLKQSLQQIFQCCGCCDNSYVPNNSSTYPCQITDPTLQRGCGPVFSSYFQQYYVTAGGCGIGFAVIMFVGMLIVCFLMQGIKQKRAEQDLAKLRANQNAEEAEIQLTMGGGGEGTTGKTRGRRQTEEEEDDEEEDEGDEEDEEDEH